MLTMTETQKLWQPLAQQLVIPHDEALGIAQDIFNVLGLEKYFEIIY